jgi:L-ascorbate metabolism protein UlaG (beta-lactamase superfamily)
MIDRIHWLGHASFRINGPPHTDGPVIYIDPWRLPSNSPPADIILISHDHHDHCSPDDVARVRCPDTLVIANQRAAERIGGSVRMLRPWQSAAGAGGVAIRAVPAYTTYHVYHDRVYGGLGFVISLMHHDIYFAGDTDLIPEMEKIGCDIALLPVGGAYTMDVEAAAEAVKLVKPLYAIPMHYGREVPGSRDNGRRFVQMVNSGVRAVEMQPETVITYV